MEDKSLEIKNNDALSHEINNKQNLVNSCSKESGIGFTCKHCQTSFKNITDLTVHMNSTGHFKASSTNNTGSSHNSNNLNSHNSSHLGMHKLNKMNNNGNVGVGVDNKINNLLSNGCSNPLALQNTLKNFFGLAALRNKQFGSIYNAANFNNLGAVAGSMGYGLGMSGLAGLYTNPFLTRDQPTTEI